MKCVTYNTGLRGIDAHFDLTAFVTVITAWIDQYDVIFLQEVPKAFYRILEEEIALKKRIQYSPRTVRDGPMIILCLRDDDASGCHFQTIKYGTSKASIVVDYMSHRLICTHLTSSRAPDCQKKRIEQFVGLLDYIGEKTIVGGDFNLNMDNEKDLFEHSEEAILGDAWLLAGHDIHTGFTCNDRRFDKFYVTADVHIKSCNIVNNVTISDHLPVSLHVGI